MSLFSELLPNFPQNMSANCDTLIEASARHQEYCRRCERGEPCDDSRKLFGAAWDYIGQFKNLTPRDPIFQTRGW